SVFPQLDSSQRHLLRSHCAGKADTNTQTLLVCWLFAGSRSRELPIQEGQDGHRLTPSNSSYVAHDENFSLSSRDPDESDINHTQNEDWWPSIGPFVDSECLQHAHFRRYPGDWTQKCISPRQLSNSLLSVASGMSTNTSSSSKVDGQQTFMKKQSETGRKETFRRKLSPLAVPLAATHSSPQTQVLDSLATSSKKLLPESNAAHLARVQQPGFVCHVAPCKDKRFDSMESLRAHDDKAHRYRCERGCSDVGYPSARDLEFRHYHGPLHSKDDGKYRCGRCGKPDSRQDNHTRHLERRRPCQAKSKAQRYACGRCGNETYDKQEHLRHLHRRGCS
ncbi:hypothetical protein RB213_010323, partial [Colletotrichum asianum]